MKQETTFLYCKKQKLCQQLYSVHLNCAYSCNGMWHHIQTSFNSQVDTMIRSSSRYTHRWYMSANLYDIYRRCVYSEKLLMMDRGTLRNM